MKRYQNRNRPGLYRERWMMAAGSILVLGALTLTGVYVRNLSSRSFDGYIVDLTTLEELDRHMAGDDRGFSIIDHLVPSDDLDHDPFFQETSGPSISTQPAGNLPNDLKEQIGGRDPDIFVARNNNIMEGITSSELDIGELIMATEGTPRPGLTSVISEEDEMRQATRGSARQEEAVSPTPAPSVVPAISTSMQSALTFREGDNLVWPIVGNVLINYSMDKSVYFPTLKQFRYNPAIIIAAREGDTISAAAAGKVTSVFSDVRIGDGIKIDLGNGFEVTYGQLKNILVSEGSFVAAGDIVAEVAAPTKYYSVEGTNVYFKLTKDGVPVNPLSKLN